MTGSRPALRLNISVEAAPTTGADMSIISQKIASLRELPCARTTVTVFNPSLKSCAIMPKAIRRPDLDAHLKADADRNSVKETVEGEARRRHRAKFRLVSLRQMRVFARAMHRGVSLESKEREESERGDRHIRCAVVECENFRQNVEESDGEDGAGTETEQQMKPVAQANSGGPAQAGGDESYQGKKNRRESHGWILLRYRRSNSTCCREPDAALGRC